jgi:hypothetical protein
MASRNAKIIVTTALLATGITTAVVINYLNNSVKLYKDIPNQVFTRQPEIKSAYGTYVKNGAKYIWGPNDCSVFVMNYIKACNKQVPFRPTTATLMEPKFMSDIGFKKVETATKTGDIIVYRYLNNDNQWRGHTGVVAWHNNRLWVVHNTASYSGVVMEDLNQFTEKATRLTKNKNSLMRIYRRSDYDSWYAQFKKRRDQS